jgi:hypothetical protein
LERQECAILLLTGHLANASAGGAAHGDAVGPTGQAHDQSREGQ